MPELKIHKNFKVLNEIHVKNYTFVLKIKRMSIPANLKYTKDHEWVSIDGDLATVGITVTVDATTAVVTGTAAERNIITTGSGADTITFTGDADWVGVAGGSPLVPEGA